MEAIEIKCFIGLPGMRQNFVIKRSNMKNNSYYCLVIS